MATTPDDWTPEQNDLFARMHKFLVANQSAIVHPDAPTISAEYFQTIAHNASWVAAEMMTGDDLRVIDDDTQEVIAESPQELNS